MGNTTRSLFSFSVGLLDRFSGLDKMTATGEERAVAAAAALAAAELLTQDSVGIALNGVQQFGGERQQKGRPAHSEG